MFWGECSHSIDKKGRIIVPARYRPHLCEGAFLTRGLDQNLVIYPQTAWENLTEQLNQMPLTHPTGQAWRRLLFSGAMELALDRQGRLLIPVHLRNYAALDGEAFIVGMENFIEIWEPSRWHSTLDHLSTVLADADSRLTLSLS